MTVKLVGRADVTQSGILGQDYIWMTKFTAVATGDVTEMRFRVGTTVLSYIYIGIYADSSGAPAALLGQTAITEVAAGEPRVVTVTLDSAIPVIYGTGYWIAFTTSKDFASYKTETAVFKYKVQTSFLPLPNPAGTGYTSITTYSVIVAGWGIASKMAVLRVHNPTTLSWTYIIKLLIGGVEKASWTQAVAAQQTVDLTAVVTMAAGSYAVTATVMETTTSTNLGSFNLGTITFS